MSDKEYAPLPAISPGANRMYASIAFSSATASRPREESANMTSRYGAPPPGQLASDGSDLSLSRAESAPSSDRPPARSSTAASGSS